MKADDYKLKVISDMERVGTYHSSFDGTINMYCSMLEEYDKIQEQFIKTGSLIVIKHTNKFGATNLVDNPIYKNMERLRKDLIMYAKELGLTPSGLTPRELKRLNNAD